MMKKVNISQVDALFANGIYPIEFLFYFKEELNTKKIRNTLKKLSAVFWPMFGEYEDGIISFEKYVEDEYYDEEVVDQKFQIPATEKERLEIYSQYCLPDTKKLFQLKITQFENGMILVPKMMHLAGDGYSYFFFLSSLAILSQHTLFPSKSSFMQRFFKPHHSRTALKNFSFKGMDLNLLQQNNQFTIAFDEILRKDVQSLIREVAESKNFRISTNDVLSAMAVKKLSGVQKEFEGEFVELTIPIDVRRQVKEYGRRFFGNGIMLHKMMLKKENIENLPTEEIAVQIRKSMPSVSKQSYVDYLTMLEEIISEGKTEKFRPFYPASGYLVTNISRLPVDRLNFGTGPPDLIYPLTLEKNAAAVMAKDENFILRFAY
ncbi:MAG: acyltransferase [Candidatus Aminicenantaceae bacterium]